MEDRSGMLQLYSKLIAMGVFPSGDWSRDRCEEELHKLGVNLTPEERALFLINSANKLLAEANDILEEARHHEGNM